MIEKTLVFQVKRTEVLEYVVRFEGENPPWTEEELALGEGLRELNDMECDEEFELGITKLDYDVVWESPDELVAETYRLTEVP